MSRLFLFVLILSLTLGPARTKADLIRFMSADNTDRIIYQPGTFECKQFSEMLVDRLRAAGWTAGYAVVGLYSPSGLPDTSHEFVWVDLPSGRVYIEPQDDGFYHPEVGKRLCDGAGCLGDYRISYLVADVQPDVY